MRYNRSPLPTAAEPPASQIPSRFRDNPQSFACNAAQRCAAADSCAAKGPDPKGTAVAGVQGERYPAPREAKLFEIVAGSKDLPRSPPETERFVDVP